MSSCTRFTNPCVCPTNFLIHPHSVAFARWFINRVRSLCLNAVHTERPGVPMRGLPAGRARHRQRRTTVPLRRRSWHADVRASCADIYPATLVQDLQVGGVHAAVVDAALANLGIARQEYMKGDTPKKRHPVFDIHPLSPRKPV